jgi:hypothetical protein
MLTNRGGILAAVAALACLAAPGLRAQACHDMTIGIQASSSGSCTGALAGDIATTHQYTVTCYNQPGSYSSSVVARSLTA